MVDKKKEYIEFTKICGDCGRRFKMKFEMPDFKDKKDRNKFVDFFFEKYNICCNQCNKKKQEQEE
jgi:hypothetical protein